MGLEPAIPGSEVWRSTYVATESLDIKDVGVQRLASENSSGDLDGALSFLVEDDMSWRRVTKLLR